MQSTDYFILAIIIIIGALYFAARAGIFSGQRYDSGTGKTGKNLSRQEKKVLETLQEQGYRLKQIHPFVPLTYRHETDKTFKEKEIIHAVNFAVSRRGRKYLVKLVKKSEKTGGTPSPASPDFRNELLLHHLFFLPAGIIIYNTDNNSMEKVSFKPGSIYAIEKKFAGITFGLLMFAAIIWIVFYIFTEVFSF